MSNLHFVIKSENSRSFSCHFDILFLRCAKRSMVGALIPDKIAWSYEGGRYALCRLCEAATWTHVIAELAPKSCRPSWKSHDCNAASERTLKCVTKGNTIGKKHSSELAASERTFKCVTKGNTIGKKHSSELARTGHYSCHFVGTKSNRWVTRPFVGLQSLGYSLNVKQNATINYNLP